MSVNITWLGHSCFLIDYNGYRIVLDPYRDDKVPGLGPLRVQAHEVLCSHQHDDHNWVGAVALQASSTQSPFSIDYLETYHDENKGTLRGHNRITILGAGAITVAHFGDLGAFPTADQLEVLKNVDVALLPVGGYYTIDGQTAHELAEVISARIVIPMHYRSATFGFDLINTLDEFCALRDNAVFYETNAISVDSQTPAQTAILTYQPPQ